MANVKKDKMSFHSRYCDYEFQISLDLSSNSRRGYCLDQFAEWDYFDSLVRKNLKGKGEKIEERVE